MGLQAKSCFSFKFGGWQPMPFHEVRVVCDGCGRAGDYLAELELQKAVTKATVWATKQHWQCITDQTFCPRCRLTPEGVGA